MRSRLATGYNKHVAAPQSRFSLNLVQKPFVLLTEPPVFLSLCVPVCLAAPPDGLICLALRLVARSCHTSRPSPLLGLLGLLARKRKGCHQLLDQSSQSRLVVWCLEKRLRVGDCRHGVTLQGGLHESGTGWSHRNSSSVKGVHRPTKAVRGREASGEGEQRAGISTRSTLL